MGTSCFGVRSGQISKATTARADSCSELSDGRSALLKLAPLARTKIHGLFHEIRAVNDLFFGPLNAQSFAALCESAEALLRGSREAMQYIARIEEEPEN